MNGLEHVVERYPTPYQRRNDRAHHHKDDQCGPRRLRLESPSLVTVDVRRHVLLAAYLNSGCKVVPSETNHRRTELLSFREPKACSQAY